MVPIQLSDKYATTITSYHNLRVDDFKSVLAVHDPKDGTDHEIMFISATVHVNIPIPRSA